jgi:hypothetical protein
MTPTRRLGMLVLRSARVFSDKNPRYTAALGNVFVKRHCLNFRQMKVVHNGAEWHSRNRVAIYDVFSGSGVINSIPVAVWCHSLLVK